jgi:hypothetical protein
MFCDEQGEWAYSLFGDVCQAHWENPHDAVSLRAELVALRARLDEAEAVITGLRELTQAAEWVRDGYAWAEFGDEYLLCIICGNSQEVGHAPDCLYAKAYAAAWLAAAPQEEAR